MGKCYPGRPALWSGHWVVDDLVLFSSLQTSPWVWRLKAWVSVSSIEYMKKLYHVTCKTIEISILHVNNNSFRGPLIIGTFENWTSPEADAALMSVSLMTARESYGQRSDHEFLTCHQVSVSRPVPKRTLRKWQMTESKTEKKNYVGKESSGSVRR